MLGDQDGKLVASLVYRNSLEDAEVWYILEETVPTLGCPSTAFFLAGSPYELAAHHYE